MPPLDFPVGLLDVFKKTPPFTLGLLAGVLLIVAGVTGVATWEGLGQLVRDNIADNTAVEWTFKILVFLASLGGLLVIAGAYLIAQDKIDLGRLLITIGVGTGLIGLVLLIWGWTEEKPAGVTVGFLIGFTGIILSVVARQWAKKLKKD